MAKIGIFKEYVVVKTLKYNQILEVLQKKHLWEVGLGLLGRNDTCIQKRFYNMSMLLQDS